MSVRAKFKVQSVLDYGYSKTVKLSANYDTSIPEDQRFAKATPCADITMTIDNPEASEQFKPGQAFYVDFTPISPPG